MNRSSVYVIPIMLFVTSAAFVWFAGSHIAIDGYMPLVQQDRRLWVIAALFVIFSCKLFWGRHKLQPIKLAVFKNVLIQKSWRLLGKRMEGAAGLLRRMRITNDSYRAALNYLPWYLLIGAPGSGKTSLIAHANIRFTPDKLSQEENSKAVPAADTGEWWVAKDLVLVDVPGAYVTVNRERIAMINKRWLAFLALIKRMRGHYGLDGVVISFSVADLMDRERCEASLLDLRSSIASLKDKFGRELSFYIVITKCDLLPGFMDFFGECSIDELDQAWGVTMPALSIRDSLADVFSARFDALIKKLNQQLLLRLHQERNVYSRVYIKDFPLQVERLKESLLTLLKGLTVKEAFCLKGVYLTSSEQSVPNPDKTEPPQTVPGDDFQRSLQIMQRPVMPSQSCFVKQFILHALVPARRYNYSSKLKANRKRITHDNRGK